MVGTNPSPTPKPPLLTLSHNYSPSPERPGSVTPPIFSSAAVPFRWEESPGKPKPKPCTAVVDVVSRKSLDLPPRLLLTNQSQASSFRMVAGECYKESGTASFRGAVEKVSRKRRRRGLLLLGGNYWNWKWKSQKVVVGGGSYVFPSSADREIGDGEIGKDGGTSVKVTRAAASFSVVSSTAKPRFWGGMYEGLKKHAFPWRGKKGI